MNIRQWKDGETVAHFIYFDEYGRIVGEVNRAGHQMNTKHTTAVYPNTSDSISLGMYISSDTAKAAVEKFWLLQERTLIENE